MKFLRFFIFTPIPGERIHFDYFSKGLKTPTGEALMLKCTLKKVEWMIMGKPENDIKWWFAIEISFSSSWFSGCIPFLTWHQIQSHQKKRDAKKKFPWPLAPWQAQLEAMELEKQREKEAKTHRGLTLPRGNKTLRKGTLPKTNIAIENPGNKGVFMGYVSFREGSI